MFWLVRKTQLHKRPRVLPFTANDAYNVTLRAIDHSSEWVTARFQRGSLPFYVGTIFVVFVVAEGTALLPSSEWCARPTRRVAVSDAAHRRPAHDRRRHPGRPRPQAVHGRRAGLGDGLGLVVLFATSGAPDLALTQVLVETVTLVVFALVLRRLPARMGSTTSPSPRSPGPCWARAWV